LIIALIEYGMGNIQSVRNALECVGAEVRVTSRKEDLVAAGGIVIPGVGAFADGIRNLTRMGVIETLREEVLTKKKPFLGICLGMQFLAEVSFEFGETAGLGFIPGKIVRLQPDDRKKFKIPHMGWNNVEVTRPASIFAGVSDDPVFYFVHSYHFETDRAYISAICRHGQDVTAAVSRENIHGVQFHPEKSQGIGLKVLENFCAIVEGNGHA
jgi:imidazole glycerol-phosphate synthase subunit HisH